ncbi:hypothetical protein [Streptomyces shenzhenensis]|uniref:hypothetical protein n=1 Tax=Streptomyces shenzhenensis TaxID=943815 RepID=UPI00369FB4DB
MITGTAAAPARRSSKAMSEACGSTDRDIRKASAQPGRIGSGVIARASNSAASTAFVDGRSTAAASVRVAMSTMPVSSTVSTVPSS